MNTQETQKKRKREEEEIIISTSLSLCTDEMCASYQDRETVGEKKKNLSFFLGDIK